MEASRREAGRHTYRRKDVRRLPCIHDRDTHRRVEMNVVWAEGIVERLPDWRRLPIVFERPRLNWILRSWLVQRPGTRHQRLRYI